MLASDWSKLKAWPAHGQWGNGSRSLCSVNIMGWDNYETIMRYCPNQMSHTNTIKNKMWKMIKQWTKYYACPDAANETLEILVSGSYLVQKQHLVNSSKTLSLPPPARRRALGEQRVQRVGHVHLVLRRLDLLHRRHDGRQRCRCRLD